MKKFFTMKLFLVLFGLIVSFAALVFGSAVMFWGGLLVLLIVWIDEDDPGCKP